MHTNTSGLSAGLVSPASSRAATPAPLLARRQVRAAGRAAAITGRRASPLMSGSAPRQRDYCSDGRRPEVTSSRRPRRPLTQAKQHCARRPPLASAASSSKRPGRPPSGVELGDDLARRAGRRLPAPAHRANGRTARAEVPIAPQKSLPHRARSGSLPLATWASGHYCFSPGERQLQACRPRACSWGAAAARSAPARVPLSSPDAHPGAIDKSPRLRGGCFVNPGRAAAWGGLSVCRLWQVRGRGFAVAEAGVVSGVRGRPGARLVGLSRYW